MNNLKIREGLCPSLFCMFYNIKNVHFIKKRLYPIIIRARKGKKICIIQRIILILHPILETTIKKTHK